jgi:hypothetical protein
MKLFYTPVERMLLSINDPATVVMNKFLWNKAWDIWAELDRKESRLTNKEVRLASHVAGLLQI